MPEWLQFVQSIFFLLFLARECQSSQINSNGSSVNTTTAAYQTLPGFNETYVNFYQSSGSDPPAFTRLYAPPLNPKVNLSFPGHLIIATFYPLPGNCTDPYNAIQQFLEDLSDYEGSKTITIPQMRILVDPPISDAQSCQAFYSCFFPFLYLTQSQFVLLDASISRLCPCLRGHTNTSLVCPLRFGDPREALAQAQVCPSFVPGLYNAIWYAENVEQNLQTFITSGSDTNTIWWPGLQDVSSIVGFRTHVTSSSFSSNVGAQMLGDIGFQCSLENPCSPSVVCGSAGSAISMIGHDARLLPMTWPLLVVSSLKNINQQLSNQYIAIKGAAIEATLRSFDVGVFYPVPSTHFGLLNILQGLTSAFALLAGFLPAAGTLALSTGSAAVGAVGAYLGRYVSNTTAAGLPQEKFADSVLAIYASLVEGLDSLAELLFNGSSIDQGFNITTMMQGGAWVDASSLQRVTDIEQQMATEIISRAVNDLWKTPTHNKIFVTFVDLKDTPGSTANCKADSSGPPPFKYCADGGVYYAYNFIEDGAGRGHLGWPWGADKLKQNFQIDPSWISEASAKTYRLAKVVGPPLDPFNFTSTNATLQLFSQSLLLNHTTDINSFAGRLPGSWTLPVCDMSTWGANWNHNYIADTELQLAPCLCGPGGNETKTWANAAGMHNFQTYHSTCKIELTQKNLGFHWPDGVTSVDLGFGDAIQKPK